LKRHQADYAAFYQRKFHEVKKHQHQRALILTARKAVRLIFALLHKGQMQRLKEEPLP
jgi:transposase